VERRTTVAFVSRIRCRRGLPSGPTVSTQIEVVPPRGSAVNTGGFARSGFVADSERVPATNGMLRRRAATRIVRLNVHSFARLGAWVAILVP
jgi:hypothetical protein